MEGECTADQAQISPVFLRGMPAPKPCCSRNHLSGMLPIQESIIQDRSMLAWVFLLNRCHKTNRVIINRPMPNMLQWRFVAVEGGRTLHQRKTDPTLVMRLASLT